MQLIGKLVEFGKPFVGESKTTGKPWVRRTLSFLVPYYTSRGEEKYDNICADYFGDITEEVLISFVENQTTLSFTVSFNTREYNGRRYQEARVFNLAAKI